MGKIVLNVVPILGSTLVTKKETYEIIKIQLNGKQYTVYRDENKNYFLLPQSTRLRKKVSICDSWENVFIDGDKMRITLTRFDTGQYSVSYVAYK